MRKSLFFAVFCTISITLFAQRAKNGNLTVSSSVKVNEYTYLTANAPAGTNVITVASSTLNSNNRFSGNLTPGDLIMIIQMQGATLRGRIDSLYGNVGLPNDSSWGGIVSYNNCGNYEFAEVSAVPSPTTIKLDCPLLNSYTDTGKVQIVRIPRYGSLTINNGGTITCDPWDSAIGGIIAMEVENNTTINSGGAINADSAGFRGGRYNSEDSIGWGVQWCSSTFQTLGKEKGEGIGGYEWNYKKYGGKEGMGAPGNGGGGGNVQNGGGGGGANGGVVANYINGFGNPDVSTPDNITAWKLEYSWMPTFTSSGGGRGGYTYSANNVSPLIYPPGDAANWGGDQRRNVGGRGGRPLDYSTGKIFMAGGGGAGDQNDGNGGIGGKGGGIVYLISYGAVSGAGQIVANGENGFNSHGVAAFGHAAGIDAGGGAGAGGTIVVNSTGHISGISLNANGGVGGNQVMVWNFSTDAEAEGPGGGGSGGYIATSNAGIIETVTGGANGTTNAKPMVNFLPNGATIGGAGTTNTALSNFYLSGINDTICSGNRAILSVSLLGNPPVGATIEWYTTDSGGTPFTTGNIDTTPVLVNTAIYYVGSCPGTYRIPVAAVVEGVGSIVITHDTGICKGSSDTLHASEAGASSYLWQPAAGLNNPNIANPIATPTVTTVYTISITTPCGVSKDSVKITVAPPPHVSLSANNNPICAGQSVIIAAGGGANYFWSNNATTSSITVTPASTTTYSVDVSNAGCVNDTTIKITVNPQPTVTLSGNNTICAGSSTTITATGGTSYTWSNAATTSSITVTPASTSTYTVIVSNGTCTKDTVYTITVNPYPFITITPDTAICSGNSITLTIAGGDSYLWSNSSTESSISVTPATTTSYTAVVTENGCVKDTVVTVSVNPSPVVNITGHTMVCMGGLTTLKATGGGTYKWSTGATADSITVSPAKTTGYTVTVTNGCKSIVSVSVGISSPTLFACCDTAIQSGSSTGLSAYTPGITRYKWAPDSGISCDTCSIITASPTITTTYTVTGTDSMGCTTERIIIVTVEGACTNLIIPNVFTPNYPGPMGLNNVFYINIGNFSSWSIDIFDRWGKEVYTSADPIKYWDGNVKGGGQAPDGVYYYTIDGVCSGNSFKMEGLVQLIR